MLFATPKGSLSLILDIQSSIIRASLVHFRKGSVPHIVYTSSKNIPHRPGSGSAKIVHTAVTVLREIIGSMYHYMNMTAHKPDFPKTIDEVHMVLSSPWVISQARTLVKDFESQTEITEKLILDIIAKERTLLMPDGVGEQGSVDIIEEKIFNVRLNGYPVHSWVGKKTKQLEISFSVSISGKNIVQMFREACTIVPPNKIFLHSSLNLQCVALRQLLPQESAYTLVHVHGELTDVAVIIHNSCVFFGSYPLGVFGVVRTVAEKGGMSIELADSSVSLYSHESLDSSQSHKNSIIVEEASLAWNNEFKKLFESVTPQIHLPVRTVICGHSHEDFFSQSLKKAYPHIETKALTFQDLQPFVSYDVPEEPIRLSGLYTLAISSLRKGTVL